MKQSTCGIVNSRGKPCQRTGFCPFHHKITTKIQKKEESDEEEEEELINNKNEKVNNIK
jgi:hypothetical protein